MRSGMRRGHVAPALREGFLSRDPAFYRDFFSMFAVLALQNMVTYSVNIADNIMLGAYSQTALAGAAAVNQIQFILQQAILAGFGEGLVIIAGQYWGRRDVASVQRLTGAALLCGAVAGGLLTLAAFALPRELTALFTDDAGVQEQAVQYLKIVRFTYLPFVMTNLLLASLRSARIVKIAFEVSCTALVLNVGINSVLIFGRFGAPELGIRGAAIGTVTARAAELALVLVYCLRRPLPLSFSPGRLFPPGRALARDYLRTSLPCVISSLLFGGAVAMQTAIFGHLSEDALAAASASGTLFQYCKMIPSSAAAAASVWIARAVGGGRPGHLRVCVHTLQVIFAGIGVVICILLLAARDPVLSLYAVSDRAREYALQMVTIQAFVSVGMAYQMPCQLGIIRAGGDTRYSMISDLVYSWFVVVPLGCLAAFVWNWPFAAVVICLNCDQVLKCFTVGFKTNRYTWIRKLTQ